MNSLKTIILVLPIVLSLSACAGGPPVTVPQTQAGTTAALTGAQTVADATQSVSPTTSAAATIPATKPETAGAISALEVLGAIWAQYGENDRFPAAGGDPSEVNSVVGGPGKFSMADPILANSVLGLPESAGAGLIDAASLVHMMNANTFTAGAFQAGAPGDVAGLAEKLQSNIQKRQWMCGFPEKLLILSVGDHAVSAFGNGELIEAFKTHALAAFEEARVLVEEPIR